MISTKKREKTRENNYGKKFPFDRVQKFKLTIRVEQRSPNSRIVEISVAASYGILLKVEAKPFLNRIFSR